MRRNQDWIEAFVKYTDAVTSPKLFRKWAAISAIASALQRKCWTNIVNRQQFPNMYILLVASPGIGKTAAIFLMREICRKLPSIKLTPTRITEHALYEELEEALQTITNIKDPENPVMIHHSITAMVDEFGTFIRKGDFDFMTSLAELFDCPDPFRYRTKTSGSNFAKATFFNFISGCTPVALKDIFTEDAIEFGFSARVVIVYSKEAIKHTNLFSTDNAIFSSPEENPMFKSLVSDLEEVVNLHGAFTWSQEAQDFLSSWYAQDLRPFPQDLKLQHYCTRRLTHVTKLAMIHCASASDDMVIELPHIQAAKATLLEAETYMPQATESFGSNRYYAVQSQIYQWVLTSYATTKKPVHEAGLRRRLMREVPPFMVQQILDGMVSAGLFRLEGPNDSPNRFFKPGLIKKKE